MLANIPFFETSPIVLIKDIIEIHVFGILVGIGVVLGTWLAQKRATMAQDQARIGPPAHGRKGCMGVHGGAWGRMGAHGIA